MKSRVVARTWQTQPTMEGAGVRLQRAFSHDGDNALDPFLLLDHFGSDQREEYEAGFPWHPHRGMETITYLLAGTVEHGDSMGHRGAIGPGDVQWMTAGSGIIHQEMPHGDEHGRNAGFQLWANLPARDKMMPPRYQDFKRDEIPVVTTPEGATVRIVSGEFGGRTGPVRGIVTHPTYLDVTLRPGTTFTPAIPAGHTAFAYVFEGEGRFDESSGPTGTGLSPGRPGGRAETRETGTVVLFDQAGDGVSVRTDSKPVRFLLVSGQPLGEPVAWSGPIVMNTQAELRQAFAELRDGTFVKHPVVH